MDNGKPKYKLVELKIEVTHKCTLACLHCSSNSTPKCTKEMTYEFCEQIVNDCVSMGVREISYSGGEPLLWDGIEKIIKYSSSNGLTTNIYTTGNVPNNLELIKNMKAAGISKIIFSLYGFNHTTHEHITRIRDSFKTTINAIKYASNQNIKTEIHFVALSRNYNSLKKIAELGRTIGVSRISVLRFVPQGRGSALKNDILKKHQLIELKNLIESLRESGYDIRTGSPFNVLLINKKPLCSAAIDRLIIGPDLNIYPCDAFKQIKAVDIVNTNELSTLDKNSLIDCWLESPYLNAIRSYLKEDFAEPCKSCINNKLCLSGCLAQKVLYYGRLLKKPDPICLLN